jgi:hypothetical protein
MKVHVYTTIGEFALTLDDGQAIYDLIHRELLDGHSVELDFSGVRVFASPFFNAAIGQLYKDLDPVKLKNLLTMAEMTPPGKMALERVIENAQRYYANPRYRNAVDRVMTEQAATV